MTSRLVQPLEGRAMLSGLLPVGAPGVRGDGDRLEILVRPSQITSRPVPAVLVKDINRGPADSINMPWLPKSPRSEMAAVGGAVLFGADDGRHGFTLWRSDGTPGGTRIVRPKLGDIEQFTSLAGTLFFVRNGRELWRSDGTNRGTTRVKGFAAPRQNESGYDSLSILGTFNGSLVMQYGRRLWTSNGGAAGTRLLRDLGPTAGDIDEITAAGGQFFFAESRPRSGATRLWASDGTSDGTKVVRKIRGDLSHFDVVGDSVLFSRIPPGNADPQTWISDGTPGGTHASPWRFDSSVLFNHRIYFIQADDPTAMYSRHSLWAADETLTARNPVKTFPKGDEAFTMGPAYDGAVYFALDDGEHGVELMKTDGTQEGTVLVKDIHRGGLGSYPRNFSMVNGNLLFTAYDGIRGAGIWSTTGTPDETRPAKVLTSGGYVDVNYLFTSGTAVYITTVDGKVWRSDGTSAGTKAIGDFNGGRLSPTKFTSAGPHVFFFALEDAHGAELWMEP